ncbi:MarR family transcriptional regulator [Mesorhizobium soli]|uniref:MarR family transcriptional regulator n=2 Tax=Pseudaminobacter soli (ex Li et al. 2025) TaxID=1295366 RepID=A0A2P7S0W0_9HYPH|nr:MarR family transcriptional regulator [Mesorhizobium soli]
MGLEDAVLLRNGGDRLRVVPDEPRRDQHSDAPQASCFDLARLLDRSSRRFSGLISAELTRLGVDDIGPAQVMVLLAIGDTELSVGELLDRGNYVGSNISYYLKQLTEGDYIARVTSQRDKRSARIRLTEKGRQLCADLKEAAKAFERTFCVEQDLQDLAVAFQALHRLELMWANAARFGA